MKKIVFLMLHLGIGGAEKAVISQANLLADKYEVEIISMYRLSEKPAFAVHPKVKITYLSENLKPNREELKAAIRRKAVWRVFREVFVSLKVLYLRKACMKRAIRACDGDIIISSRYLYHRMLTKNAGKSVVCIAQEHNHHNNNEKYIHKMINAVKDMQYFMPVSKELTDFYTERLAEYPVQCRYIPHYLEEFPEEFSELTTKNMISVGRLSPEKGYLELVELFAEFSRNNPDWKLHIIGDGSCRKQLEERIGEEHLESRIVLHGFRNKPYINEQLKQSSVYVMTSLTEAFGLVLLEAQSYGVPCIAYDSARGALEIIESGRTGILIENRNREKMLHELQKLADDYELRKKSDVRVGKMPNDIGKKIYKSGGFNLLTE